MYVSGTKKQYPTQKKGFVYLKGNLSIGITFIPLSISLDSPFNGKKNVVSNAESWKVIKHKKDNNGNNSDQIRVICVFTILIYMSRPHETMTLCISSNLVICKNNCAKNSFAQNQSKKHFHQSENFCKREYMVKEELLSSM